MEYSNQLPVHEVLGLKYAELDEQIFSHIDRLDPSDVAGVMEARAVLDYISTCLKSCKAAMEQKTLDCVRNQGGEVRVGNTKYYESAKRTVKCIDKVGVFEALVDKFRGDELKVLDCMTTEPFRQGSVKRLIGEKAHAKLFKVKIDPFIKQLTVVDTRFLK